MDSVTRFWDVLNNKYGSSLENEYHQFMDRMRSPMRGFGDMWLLPARIVDAARNAYNALLTDFEELTGECAWLWDEVRGMRGVIAAWKLEQERQKIRIADLEMRLAAQAAAHTDLVDTTFTLRKENQELRKSMYVQPRVRLDFEYHADGSYTVHARDQFATKLDSKKMPPQRVVGGYELTMDVRGTKVTGRVYELEPYYSSQRRVRTLCEREIAMPAFDKALVENEELKEENDDLRTRLATPTLEDDRAKAWLKVYDAIRRVWWTPDQLRERGSTGMERAVNAVEDMAAKATAPVTYGVDFGNTNADKTVVTVRQGDKVLHVIDVDAHYEKWQKERESKPYAGTVVLQNMQLTFPKLLAEAERVAATTWGRKTPRQIVQPEAFEVARAALVEWQHGRVTSLGNHHCRWTPMMDKELLDAYHSGYALRVLALHTRREWEAVLYRLAHLCHWPKPWGYHSAFLKRAWLWFFTTRGCAKPTTASRRDALMHRPTVFP